MNSWIIHNDSNFRWIITFGVVKVINIIYKLFFCWFYWMIRWNNTLNSIFLKSKYKIHDPWIIISKYNCRMTLYTPIVNSQRLIATWNHQQTHAYGQCLLNGTEISCFKKISKLLWFIYFMLAIYGHVCMSIPKLSLANNKPLTLKAYLYHLSYQDASLVSILWFLTLYCISCIPFHFEYKILLFYISSYSLLNAVLLCFIFLWFFYNHFSFKVCRYWIYLILLKSI